MKALNQLNCIENTKYIMIIDDESHIGLFMEVLLSSRGYMVTSCSDSYEALSLFADKPELFHLVITDQNMPKMCGTELSKRLLAIRPDVPIILCTGFAYEDIARTTDKIGIAAILPKPLQANVLLDQIEGLINGVGNRNFAG